MICKNCKADYPKNQFTNCPQCGQNEHERKGNRWYE